MRVAEERVYERAEQLINNKELEILESKIQRNALGEKIFDFDIEN